MTEATPPDSGGNAEDRAERERLQRLGESYSTSPYYRKIWLSDSQASRLMGDRKWLLIDAVLRGDDVSLRSARILDLGVGSGTDSSRFETLNARPECYVGLDFLEVFAREARRSNPWMSTMVGDAGCLPFPDGTFNLVYQSTMLSSVLGADRRERIFREIARVLAPGGVFLSYDTRYPNPWNPHTRPLRSAELRRAFPGWRVKAWSLTAIPQLQRALAPYSPAACRLLEAIPLLRSHLVVLARRA